MDASDRLTHEWHSDVRPGMVSDHWVLTLLAACASLAIGAAAGVGVWLLLDRTRRGKRSPPPRPVGGFEGRRPPVRAAVVRRRPSAD